MQRSLPYPTLGPSDLEDNPAFNVVIAYEDFETGKHAKKTYDFLVANLGKDCQFTNQMWKFDVLGLPKLREMAAKAAALAEIVIISSQGGQALPHQIKSLIELWVGYNSTSTP